MYGTDISVLFGVVIFVFGLNDVEGLTIVNPYGPVPRRCMDCICDTVSECSNEAICVEGDACGPLRITPGFWYDAGQPTINGEAPESEDAFANCATDLKCSWAAAQAYMERNKKDCNGDGMVDCKDYFALHLLGSNCNQTLHENFLKRYDQCDHPNKIVPAIQNNDNFFIQNYDDICSKCICEAASGCNSTIDCEGDFCGPFRISKAYWILAERPVLAGDDPDRRTAYEDCVLDKECAERAVRQYFREYARDCNDDNVTTCSDYLMLHYNAGTQCSLPVDHEWVNRYQNCIKINVPEINEDILQI